ncbi:MAG TPA: hypothetical protein DCQ06_13280 [Myxococcales bacterium]|nr:hypothetical protein [Myxococcales bacterium]
MVIPGLHCKHLAPTGSTWGCQVYQERFERAPWCYHADEAGPQGFLAHDCPYSHDSAHGGGKVRLPPAAMDRIWPAIFREIRRVGVPHWIDRSAFTSALNARQDGHWNLVAGDDPQRLWPQSLLTKDEDSESPL